MTKVIYRINNSTLLSNNNPLFVERKKLLLNRLGIGHSKTCALLLFNRY